MWNDPIVEEVRRVREEHCAKFNFDIDEIVKDYQMNQNLSKNKVVSFSKNKKVQEETILI